MSITNFPTLVLFFVLVAQGNSIVGQPKGEQKQGPIKKQVAVSQTPIPSIQPVSEPPKSGDAANTAQRPMQVTIVDERSRAFEWVGIVVNGLLLLFVGYQALANRRQLQFMREALAQGKTDSAKHERATKAAEDSVGVAREAFHLGEAPYFGIPEVSFDDFEIDLYPKVKIVLINGGKSPAWRIHTFAKLHLGKTPDKSESWELMRERQDMRNTFMPAGAAHEFHYKQIGF